MHGGATINIKIYSGLIHNCSSSPSDNTECYVRGARVNEGAKNVFCSLVSVCSTRFVWKPQFSYNSYCSLLCHTVVKTVPDGTPSHPKPRRKVPFCWGCLTDSSNMHSKEHYRIKTHTLHPKNTVFLKTSWFSVDMEKNIYSSQGGQVSESTYPASAQV